MKLYNMGVVVKVNPDFRAIIEYIRTSTGYIDLIELFDWCESESYLRAYYDNFHVIQALVIQHNERLK